LFQVLANPEKNRLYVTLEGHLEAPERKDLTVAFLNRLRELKPGFDLVHDMSGLHPTDQEGLRELLKVQAILKVKGVRTVIRIAKIPLARVQLERAARETGWAFETAASVEEADARLDALGPAVET